MTKQMTAAFDAAKDGSKRTVAMFAVLAAAVALVMASAAPAFAQTTVEGADGNVWSPDSITVEAGTTVTFNMTGGDGAHNGQLDDGTEAFGFINVGDSTTYTFANEGSFVLSCTIHPGMDLDVTVTAASNGGDDNGDDNGTDDNGDDTGTDDGDDTGTDDDAGTDDTDDSDDSDEVEQPSSVDSGSGGLVQTGLPLWVGALMALGALALVAPAVASRRRS